MMGPVKEGFQVLGDKIGEFEDTVNTSTFGRVFRLDGSGHPKTVKGASFYREIRAGFTTFATMAYIIAVNASVLTESGGTCICKGTPEDPGCVLEQEYTDCLLVLKRDMITATAALAGLASIAFGFLTNLPVALAPGMGLNAYFTYQVVGWHGTGMVPYRIALTAIFVEGFIFIFLALTGMRQWLVKMIPATIKTACGVGIGLFLTEIGLSYSAGIGAITGGHSTPLAIGGCPANMLNDDGECIRHIMRNPAMWIGIMLGGILVAFLMAFKVKSAIIIGIGVVSILSWPRSTSFTYFPYTTAGQERFDFFKQIIAFHPIQNILAAQQWNLDGTSASQFALALITFLYVDIIDCTATLYSMAKFCGVVGEDGDFPRSTVAYCTDAACISIGSLFGCSPVTAFIESGSGIAEGGRTGLTAITAGVCFLISLFFAPILASIPPWATGCTLVLVGCLMIRQVTSINWQYIGDAVPSFVTLAFMPFSYSVAYGLIAGMLIYVSLNTMIWVVVHLTGGRVTPSNWNEKEVYNWGMGKRDMPRWMRILAQKMTGRNNQDFEQKDAVEMVDTESSTVRTASQHGSSEPPGSPRGATQEHFGTAITSSQGQEADRTHAISH
ncbi:xanthine/uracil permease family protein-like protein [Pseudomassariella vexata]|uniref:Xanthine/uracil permease family protein-like protein n=1 Tax=Pseudomassariella vexata TaxID=1141098 RepID=A0A1Y2EJN3_9PEZI|nr:xanthine/uracil permease family protein-like protein [Pseudomassariella vexata]ORY71783.1 xanthine/uracil permease family protein-like protein [Pseudomassariella vexata]